MKKTVFIIFLVFLCVSISGQDTTDELLKSVRSKYDSFNTLSVNFSKSTGAKEDFSGKLYLKKENKLRIEFKNNTIITDSKTFWNFNKKENKVIINNYDPSEPTEFSLHSFIYNYPAKCTITSGTDGNYRTLTLVPKNSELNFKSAELFINDSSLVEKIVIDDNYGNSTITLSGYKINPDLSDSEFTFSPPKGTKVIDLR